MIKCKLILTFFLLSSIFTFGQSKIKGIILDSLSKEPIPYVHILTKDGKATISDEKGHFLTTKNNNIVIFSAIGYESKEIKLSGSSITVFLTPEIYLLPGIKVLPEKTSIIEIGNVEKIRWNQINTSLGSLGNGSKVVKFISPEQLMEGAIKSISFYVADKAKFNQLIRLLLYLPDSLSQKPSTNLLRKSIITSLGKKKKWHEIDITNLHIPVPSNGFYVGLEFLPIFGDYPFQDKLHIGLIGNENKQFTWTKMMDDEWKTANFLKTYKGQIANLMVKMKIESPLSELKKIDASPNKIKMLSH